MLVIPNLQKAPVYSASYVDVLAADNSSQDYADAIRPDSAGEGLPQ